MVKWEYMTAPVPTYRPRDDKFVNALNLKGNEGWELIDLVFFNENNIVTGLFKRPRSEKKIASLPKSG